jgi:hypothetical protein
VACTWGHVIVNQLPITHARAACITGNNVDRLIKSCYLWGTRIYLTNITYAKLIHCSLCLLR